MKTNELKEELKEIKRRTPAFLRGYYDSAFSKGLRSTWRHTTPEQKTQILDALWKKLIQSKSLLE